MSAIATLWWLSFWTACGLSIGSFLNAVIFRLPRGRSLRNPLWSACPHCNYRLSWYDNIPILSFMMLRGRCRRCDVPIATRYLVIEAVMALTVLLLLDAFFIGRSRAGLSNSEFGLTDRLAFDWPIFVAHIVLFACLLAMSAIDLEHYWVDIRFTNFVTIVGFALHFLWTPRHKTNWVRPDDTTAVAAIFAMLGLGLAYILLICRVPQPCAAPGIDVPAEPVQDPVPVRKKPPPSLASPGRMGGWITVVFVVALFIVLALVEINGLPSRHLGRALVPLFLLFVITVSENLVPRPSDVEIVTAIHEERSSARRMVLREFLLLGPAIVFGGIGLWLMIGGGGLSTRISQAIHANWHIADFYFLRNWSPLYGLATAASGYVIAGAVGWAIRIFFTFAFGKEAFGLGDIHLMAAAGCVAGWPVVAIGFFLTCGLALLGWLVSLPFKQTRAMPLGPWLSLSFLIVVIFYDQILGLPFMVRMFMTAQYFMGTGQMPVH